MVCCPRHAHTTFYTSSSLLMSARGLASCPLRYVMLHQWAVSL